MFSEKFYLSDYFFEMIYFIFFIKSLILISIFTTLLFLYKYNNKNKGFIIVKFKYI